MRVNVFLSKFAKEYSGNIHYLFRMINRDLIRTKIVQLTYAYYQNGNKNLDNAEKELMFSLSKAYDLYKSLLSLVVSVHKESQKRYEIEKTRAEREGIALPSDKFVNNRFALQLSENIQLGQFISTQKYTWEDELEFVRKICMQIEQSAIYKDYMSAEDAGYEDDRELWRKLYKALIVDNDELSLLLEEKSLYWNDDKEIVDTFVLKTIKKFEESKGEEQELLPEYKELDDREFARKLFHATIVNAEQYQGYMSEASRNWDFSRLAYMDIVIMQIAIAEMVNFPNIPVSVTINEYVNYAKTYSTPKSSGYINGMLDAIARHLADTGKMFKSINSIK